VWVEEPENVRKVERSPLPAEYRRMQSLLDCTVCIMKDSQSGNSCRARSRVRMAAIPLSNRHQIREGSADGVLNLGNSESNAWGQFGGQAFAEVLNCVVSTTRDDSSRFVYEGVLTIGPSGVVSSKRERGDAEVRTWSPVDIQARAIDNDGCHSIQKVFSSSKPGRNSKLTTAVDIANAFAHLNLGEAFGEIRGQASRVRQMQAVCLWHGWGTRAARLRRR